MITFWGPTSSGKTALLSYLFLRSDARKSDWKIKPTAQSMPMIQAQSRQILQENLFPLGTSDSPDTPGLDMEREVSFKFENEKTNAYHLLQTKDMAGSRSLDLSSGKGDSEILESLVEAEGIVLFLDHARPHAKIEVSRTLDEMYVRRANNSSARDDRPLAVCLSKVDQLIKHPIDLKSLQDAPEEFVKHQLGDELIRTIAKYHDRVRYFPVSSVGIRLSFGSLQKSVFYDERLNMRVTERGTPINIVEPFTWIFEQLQEAS